MHEMSLAVNIIDLAVEAALREGGNRVSEVEIEIGNLAGVMVDSLEFCLEAASRKTIVDGARFSLSRSVARGKCNSCPGSFDVESFYASCPECGSVGISITGGQELKIRALTIEE